MSETPRIALARLYAAGAALAFVLALGLALLLDRRTRDSAFAGEVDWSNAATTDLIFNLTLFTAFAVHHSVLARAGAKAWLERFIAPALERSTYVWIASALFAAVCLYWRPLPVLLYQVDAGWAWMFTAARVAGVWLTLDAVSRIDPRELSGLRQAWTYGTPVAPPSREPLTLVARGGYRLVRHPIYLGWFLMVWAVPRATLGWMEFAAVSSAYLLVAIPFEERALRDRFGGEYARYAGLVRWRVLPGLY